MRSGRGSQQEDWRQKLETEREELLRKQRKKGIYLPLSLENVHTDVLEEAVNPPPTVATGIPRLDYLLDGGIRPGEVFVLAARPRVGKSALAAQLAVRAAYEQHISYIWSLEMSPQALIRRTLAAQARISNRRLRMGNLEPATINELYQAAGLMVSKLGDYLFFASSDGSFYDLLDEMGSMCDYMKHEKLPFAVIDYLQMIAPPRDLTNREQQVATMMRGIKKRAKELGIAVLVVALLGRRAEGSVPKLSDLRESGGIEADADIVGLLHRPPIEDSNLLSAEARLYLDKNRDGETGVVAMRFEGEYLRFVEMDPRTHYE